MMKKNLKEKNRINGYFFSICIVIMFFIAGLCFESWAFLGGSRDNRLRGDADRTILTSRRVVSHVELEMREGELRRFKEDNTDDEEWIAVWNEWGTIHRLYPAEFSDVAIQRRRRGTSDQFLLQEEILAKSLAFIEKYAGFLKIAVNDLVYREIIDRGSVIFCRFDQKYQGVMVYRGSMGFRFDSAGGLLMVEGDTYPDINIDSSPSVGSDEAVELAKVSLGLSGNMCRVGETGLFVLPLPYEDGLRYLLVWQIPLYIDSGEGSRVVFVNAHTGDVVVSYVIDRYGINGKISGVVLPEYYNDPPTRVSFSNLKVHLLNRSTPVREYDLEEDPGWDRQGMWEFGVPVPQNVNNYNHSHAGCPDPDRGITGNNVFGYNLSGDYTNLMRPKYLSTDTIYCQNKTGIVLTFWRWLGVEREYWEDDYGDRIYHDRATVELSNDNGQTWTVIWSNGTSQIEDGIYDSFNHRWNGWNLQFFDISDIADDHDLVIRWGMGSTDGSGTFCGWNLDDVGLYESLSSLTDPNGFFEFLNTEDVDKNMLLCQLLGQYVNVINEDGASAVNYLGDIDGNLQDQITFDWYTDFSPLKDYDEFNVFYHINVLINYIMEIDEYYDIMNKRDPVSVVVRYGDNYKNAFWSPENKICFGEGDCRPDGYRNFTHFSDIIYHEYSHAITDSFYSYLMPPLNSIRKTTSTDSTQTGPVFVTEFDAIHEAFSDYWACTINDDPLIGDGDFWINHKYVRDLDNKFKYPDDYGDDAYANSLILSGAMWETRQKIGKETADLLFQRARYGGATDFDDFLADVLSEDKMTFKGEYSNLIKDIFGYRGISRSPSPPSRLISVAGDTCIHLTWEKSSDPDLDGYYVYFRTENDIASDREDPSVRRDANNITSYTLGDLTNGTTYVIKVTAYNSYNAESEPTELVYATPYSQGADASLGAERRVFCFIDTLRDGVTKDSKAYLEGLK